MAGITWWTEARLAAVRLLAAEGLRAPEIARRLSRRYRRRVSTRAVWYAARKAGLRLPIGAPPADRDAGDGR